MHSIVAGPASRPRPDIAIHVSAYAVGDAGLTVQLHVRELLLVAQLGIDNIKDLYIARRARVTDVHLLVVGRKADAIGLIERIGQYFYLGRFRIHAVNGLLQFRLGLIALIVPQDAVGRVGKPDGTIRVNYR